MSGGCEGVCRPLGEMAVSDDDGSVLVANTNPDGRVVVRLVVCCFGLAVCALRGSMHTYVFGGVRGCAGLR